jgi:hypothetical protein
MSYIVFNIEGGIGKCILATAVCQAFHEQRPEKKLVVVSGFPDVFLGNPNVHRSFGFGNIQYFFDEYIKDKGSEIFVHNPYGETDYIYKRKHVIEIWCRLFGLEYKKEYLPKIYLTQREIDFYSRHMQYDKPLFVMQTNGGAENQPVKYSWARDIPIDLAQKVANYFTAEYHVLHIRRQDQFGLENTQPITASFRELVVLMSLSKKRLLMDSFCHHLASSLGLSSTVLWVVNSPVVFGYDFNTNIEANPFTNKPELRNSFLQEFNIVGEPLEFPYNSEAEIFDFPVVMNSLLS